MGRSRAQEEEPMLSESARPLIEATAPVIAERLPDIAPKFYQSMFEAEPQLIEEGIFSRANQRTGEQPLALAGSVVAFATHILNHPESYPCLLYTSPSPRD